MKELIERRTELLRRRAEIDAELRSITEALNAELPEQPAPVGAWGDLAAYPEYRKSPKS